MQYVLVIQTDDRDGQVSISSDVADAIVKAATYVDGIVSAQITQSGMELQYPVAP